MTKKRILGCLRVPPVQYHWNRVTVLNYNISFALKNKWSFILRYNEEATYRIATSFGQYLHSVLTVR
jgi:hypothetical protein